MDPGKAGTEAFVDRYSGIEQALCRAFCGIEIGLIGV